MKSHSDFVERADPKFPVAAYYFSPKEMPLRSRNATILVTEPFKVIDAGLTKFGKSWAIPKDAEKPMDARKKRNQIQCDN